jgi:UDP-N-acetylglucosamine 1-carboxyvinyltransferase
MDIFVINGGKRLEGTIEVSGAKNAVLPLMAVALLSNGTSVIHNVPRLRDVFTMKKLMQMFGAQVAFENHTLTIDCSHITEYEAPYDLVKTMRASVYVLGPLLARFGKARVSLPGGCAWGPRPIDLHLFGLQALNAQLTLENGYINATADRLHGAEIIFSKSSVGATGNVLMAAVLADGETIICNAAKEPEIATLAETLNAMGAQIKGVGTTELRIKGVSSLRPMNTSVIPDRIETATYITAAAITGGKITVTRATPFHLTAVSEKLREAGVSVIESDDTITVEADSVIKPVNVRTDVYPGFPTDMQAQWIALMSIADGNSVVEDTIFVDRFTHVAELNRLGANISVDVNKASITGVQELNGAEVMSTDLRASASLIIAALRARGQSIVHRVYHIDRGYEAVEKKLQALGADIRREQE